MTRDPNNADAVNEDGAQPITHSTNTAANEKNLMVITVNKENK